MIVASDIDNITFNKFAIEIRDKYVGYANEEVRDLAIRYGADPENIHEPLHFKIERYAINKALNFFAQDYIDVNNENGFQPNDDVYQRLFARTNWILQKNRHSLSAIMFTGGAQTESNRAVRSVKTKRG